MCGIVGYVGKKKVVPVIIEGLRRLEYRGYDSAGIAVGHPGSKTLELRRAAGKLGNLEEVLREHPLDGTFGIGHTRWATHGRPTEENAHPHRDCTGRIVVVHNGIVENYLDLKRALTAQGHKFVTETDTEIIAHLIEQVQKDADAAGKPVSLEAAVRTAVKRLTGALPLACSRRPNPTKSSPRASARRSSSASAKARASSPATCPASCTTRATSTFSPTATSPFSLLRASSSPTSMATLFSASCNTFSGIPSRRKRAATSTSCSRKSGSSPAPLLTPLWAASPLDSGKVFLGEMELADEELAHAAGISIAACGTSWHAGLTGKYMIERLARLPVDVDYASEYRYRDPIAGPHTLGLLITQSGETADTLAAQREMKALGSKTVAICNVVGAMVAREAHGAIYTHAGPEIGVASTKAFTSQLVALFLLAMKLGQLRGHLDKVQSIALIEELSRLPVKIEEVLRGCSAQCEELAKEFSTARDFLYLGRGIHFPISLEGALKLKRDSYIHAEGYPAGEMKHGPNALIDETLPVVVLATRDEGDPASKLRYEKTLLEYSGSDGA